MDFVSKLIILSLVLPIIIAKLFMDYPGLICRIIGHNKFTNNHFNEAGHVGRDTLECRRCWKLLKVLDYPE